MANTLSGVWFRPTVHETVGDLSAIAFCLVSRIRGSFLETRQRLPVQSAAAFARPTREFSWGRLLACRTLNGRLEACPTEKTKLRQAHQGGIHGDACGRGRPTTLAGPQDGSDCRVAEPAG